MRWEEVEAEHGRQRMLGVLEHVPPGGRHLDVGTGNGDGTVLLGERVRCLGLEYGPKSAAIAAAKGVRMLRADVRGLPFADESFDSLTCLDVLEHVPRPGAALAEMTRILRRGGLLILQTPNAELLKERLLRLVRALGRPQRQPWDRALPLAEIRRLVESAGLVIEDEEKMRIWAPHPLERLLSFSRLFLCRRPR